MGSTSLVEFYPDYEDHMRRSIRAIVGEETEKKVRIGMAKDGSGVGGELSLCKPSSSSSYSSLPAALCALVATKSEQHH